MEVVDRDTKNYGRTSALVLGRLATDFSSAASTRGGKGGGTGTFVGAGSR